MFKLRTCFNVKLVSGPYFIIYLNKDRKVEQLINKDEC